MAELIDGVLTPFGAGMSFDPYSSSLLGYLREMLQEGERINRADPAFAKADATIAYIQGQQPTSPDGSSPAYLANVILNQMKKAMKTHASALTDVRPMVAWKSPNPKFQDKAEILNQYGTVWWVNTYADTVLSDAIKYSLAAGAGDVILSWDPNYLGGETRMVARDPRDTLPFRPERGMTMQDWEGVTFRQTYPVNRLLRFYPDKAYAIKPDSGKLSSTATRFYRQAADDGPPMTLDGLRGGNPLRSTRSRYEDLGGGYPECTLYTTTFRDGQLNLSEEARLMGRPGTNWAYVVEPGKPLYPRGRMLVWTEHGLIYDGPNSYWHGMFHGERLKLDPWPWLFAGMGLMNDLQQNQNVLNFVANDLLTLLSQYVNRGTVFDKNVSDSVKRRWDPRRPNWKMTRPNNFSDGIKQAEVPNAPPWAFPFFQFLFTKFDEHAGTANLQALLQLRQMPAGDTIEKFMNALTPEIRMEARQVEVFLRGVSHQLKSNLFQFVSKERRFSLLGDAGLVVEDLDYDPDTMIPAMQEGDPGYVPDLDASLGRDERARFFTSQFIFMAAPGSLLNFSSQEHKMMILQGSRQGYVDIWTWAEVMEIPNMGTPPPMQLPDPSWDPEAHPGEQPPLVWRIPRTITERLMAQQQLGIGQTVSPAGRKASGEAPPHAEQKGDGRTVVSESR